MRSLLKDFRSSTSFHGLEGCSDLDFEQDYLAQLDTGAAWSVLSSRVVRDLGIDARLGDKVRLSTRFGSHEGRLVRVPFLLIAEEGESLESEGTFFVSNHWPVDLTFLGYSGLLDSIRFALDPQANHFYFGPGV